MRTKNNELISAIAVFENYRNNLNNMEIVTYDEILRRLKDLRSIFSTNFSNEPYESEIPF